MKINSPTAQQPNSPTAQQPNSPTAHSKRLIHLLITLFLTAISQNSVYATTTPAGSKIYPKIINAKEFGLTGGSTVTVAWPAPKESVFKLWVQIPAGSNASNATYWVYPKGNAIGSNACDSSSVDYPCYPITVDQTTAINGWTQLTLNNLATTSWSFTKAGFVTISATSINNTQLLGVAQVSYQNLTSTPLAIGQTYQGGKIFYLDSTKQHGLIAAPTDQSDGIQWYNGSWNITRATGTAIGTGKANTTTIVQEQGAGSYAAKLCDDLVLGGYSDWYLPSKDELNELYKNKDAVGGFANVWYSSSSEYGNYGSAWGQSFYNGDQNSASKNLRLAVRAVRAF